MPQGRAAPRRLVKGAKAKNKSTKGAGAARRAVRRDLRRRRTCDVCGVQCRFEEPPYPVCDACGVRRYCGEACQIADWEAGHARKCG